MEHYIVEHFGDLVGDEFEDMFRKAILENLAMHFSDEDVVALLQAYALKHLPHIRESFARMEEEIEREFGNGKQAIYYQYV